MLLILWVLVGGFVGEVEEAADVLEGEDEELDVVAFEVFD